MLGQFGKSAIEPAAERAFLGWLLFRMAGLVDF